MRLVPHSATRLKHFFCRPRNKLNRLRPACILSATTIHYICAKDTGFHNYPATEITQRWKLFRQVDQQM
jgi:hypothetical protein